MIVSENIKFTYKKNLLIEDVNFVVNEGECLVLAGKNGSGKTTMLKLLADILKPVEGSIEVVGKCAYVPQGIALFEDMTVYDNIKFFSSISNGKFDKLPFDLEKYKNVKVSKLSGGLAKIVSIACATVSDATNFLYDEPCANLDVIYTEMIKKIIKSQKEKKYCIVYAGHSFDEFSSFYDKLLFIDNGKVRLYNKNDLSKDKYLLLFDNGGENEKM